VFDDVRYGSTMNGAMYEIDSEEGPYVSSKQYPRRQHRPPAADTRAGTSRCRRSTAHPICGPRCCPVMFDMGLEVEKHHHEVAPSPERIGLRLLDAGAHRRQHADLQIRGAQCRAPVRQDGDLHVRSRFKGDNGSGMHTHQSGVEKASAPAFAGNLYADLSETALYLYRRHPAARQKRSNAFTNPANQQLQAADPVFRGAGACWPIRRATARQAAASPIVSSPKGEARRGALSRSRGPTRYS